MTGMFDHVVFGASDSAASRAFYLKALEPIGVRVVSEGPLGLEVSSNVVELACVIGLIVHAALRWMPVLPGLAFVIGPLWIGGSLFAGWLRGRRRP